jgi:hypothetical protein
MIESAATGTWFAPRYFMSDEKFKKIGEKISKDVNEVLDTSGGEMPDPNQKPAENAADAAKAFEAKVVGKINPKLDPKKAVSEETPTESKDDKIKKAG